MLYRRLYFLFPDADHARGVTRELVQAGVDEYHIHAVARDGVDLTSLPEATVRQRQDAAGRIEAVAWDTNLALFAAAAVALLAALFLATVWLAVGALLVMAATFLGGAWFALRVPDVHLDEFREAIAHGEIVLMVDVPPKRVAEIEDLVHRRHPEANVGGVGWSIEGLGI
jgi:Flp pilus assembly protein TadB